MSENNRRFLKRKNKTKWAFFVLLITAAVITGIMAKNAFREKSPEQTEIHGESTDSAIESTVLSEDNDQESVCAEVETTINETVNDVLETTEDTAEASMEQTETAAEKPEDYTEPEETAEKTDTSGDYETERPSDVTPIYDIVLDQYRQAVEMDPDEFCELLDNQRETEIILDFMSDYYSTEYNSWRGYGREQLLEDMERLKKRIDLPILKNSLPYINTEYFRMLYVFGNNDESDDKYNKLFYTYYDINKDGIAELLIGVGSASDASVIGLYTVKYEMPYVLENATGHRSYLTVYTDGTICIDGSGGASLHMYDFYRMKPDFGMLETVNRYYINYDYPESENTRKNLEEYMATLTPVTEYEWYPLFQER